MVKHLLKLAPISMAKKIIEMFRNAISFFRDCLLLTLLSLKVRYHIEELNLKKNQLILRCRYSRSFIKTTLDDAVGSFGIIEHLSSLQACWLGYYYAISLPNQQPLGFTLQMKKGRFKIVSLDHRSSVLTYLDTKLNKVYKERVTEVVQDKFVIENLDPTQACYIGMQAGYEVNKHGIEVLKKSNRPILKIVK
jgi:hypothetical protein